MKKVLKKLVAVAAVMMMLVSMCNIGLTALAWDEEIDVASIEVDPIVIYQGFDSWWDIYWDMEQYDWVDYEYYHWGDVPCVVTMTDGAVIDAWLGWDFDYKGQMFGVYYEDDQGSLEQWAPGNTYDGVVSVGSCEVAVDIAVKENPVASIAVSPITVYEGIDSWEGWYYDDDYNEVYYEYYGWNGFPCTVTMKDGTVVETIVGSECYYNGRNAYIDYEDDQGRFEQWEPGNTYTGYVSVGSVETEVDVIVKENPVASIEVAPITVYEGIHSWENSYYDDNGNEVYFQYYSWADAPCTVTMKDGTVIDAWLGWDFDYNDRDVYFSCEDYQGYWEQWEPGNTYTGYVSVGSVETEVDVIVKENPVASIEVAPITVYQGLDSWEDVYYDEYVDGEYIEYYDWTRDTPCRITMKDGSVIDTWLDWGFEYDETYGDLACEDAQSYWNQWKPGNTYTGYVSIGDVETKVDITVKESPVAAVEVEPITMPEGYVSYDWDHEFYCYCWWENAVYTVTFKDGTTQQGNYWSGIEFNGKGYDISRWDEQTMYRPWTQGETYSGFISFGGVETEASVTIVENPIASVTVEPLTYVEGSSGYFFYEDTTYDAYYWWEDMAYTITLIDGTVITGVGYDDVEIDGDYYYFLIDDHQSYKTRWLPGNTYYVTASIIGVEASVSVTIIPDATKMLMGDLNNDSTVNIADATFLFRSVNGRVILNSAQEAIADVTNDGVINIADATKLFRYVNGRILTLD